MRCRIAKLTICTLMVIVAGGCSDIEESLTELAPSTTTQRVAIVASSGATTKTSIGDDLQSTNWSTDDKVALWALREGADDFTLLATTFSLFYYGTDYNRAIFTADIDEMAEDSYTYYAAYPLPKSVEGSVATFSIPSTQSGYYDGVADIMLSEATTGGALSQDANKSCSFEFSHLTHAIRIEIPEQRDLLGGTSQLQITFPEEVVGDITFDVSSSEQITSTLSNGSKSIFMAFDGVISQTDYVWLFINPTTITGDIEFVGYTADFAPSAPITTTLSNREMAAGKITPITLTIPEEQPKSFVITIEENNLGEDIETITLTAPQGALFSDGQSTTTLSPNEDGEFEFSYTASLYEAAFKADTISISFESESAIIAGEPIVLGSEHNSTTNYISCSVPYLFEEDFSGISSTDSYDLLTGQALPGLEDYWTSGRIYAYWEANCVALKSYYLLGVTYYSYLDLDLTGMTALKEDKEVTLLITFDAEWKPNKCTKMGLTVSNDGGGSDSVSFEGDSSASSSYIPTSHTIKLSSSDSESVITWMSSGSGASGFSSGYDYIYMDNIKIQITTDDDEDI